MTVLEKLLFNLQTLAAVPKGKRICTTKEFINIEDDSVIQGFWRWKNADSRDKAIKCISKEIHTIIMISLYILESKYLEISSADIPKVTSYTAASPSISPSISPNMTPTMSPNGTPGTSPSTLPILYMAPGIPPSTPPDLSPVTICPVRRARIADLKKICKALIMASNGINNICQTYENDSDFAGRLRPLLGEINTCTTNISITLTRLGESIDIGSIINT